VGGGALCGVRVHTAHRGDEQKIGMLIIKVIQ